MTQAIQTANPLLGDEYLTDRQTADFFGISDAAPCNTTA